MDGHYFSSLLTENCVGKPCITAYITVWIMIRLNIVKFWDISAVCKYSSCVAKNTQIPLVWGLNNHERAVVNDIKTLKIVLRTMEEVERPQHLLCYYIRWWFCLSKTKTDGEWSQEALMFPQLLLWSSRILLDQLTHYRTVLIKTDSSTTPYTVFLLSEVRKYIKWTSNCETSNNRLTNPSLFCVKCFS